MQLSKNNPSVVTPVAFADRICDGIGPGTVTCSGRDVAEDCGDCDCDANGLCRFLLFVPARLAAATVDDLELYSLSDSVSYSGDERHIVYVLLEYC